MRKNHLKYLLKSSTCMLLCAGMVVPTLLSGCTNNPTDSTEGSGSSAVVTDEVGSAEQTQEQSTEPTEPFDPEPQYFEAEDATLLGAAKVGNSKEGFEGTGYVEGLAEDADGVEFSVEITQKGFYDLNFATMAQGGEKENYIKVDGDVVGSISTTDEKAFQDSICKRVYLEEGSHKIAVTKSWGWILIDSLTVAGAEEMGDEFFQVSAKLSNPNASDEAKRLMSYMTDIYGKKFLSGQNSDSMYGTEIQAIKNATGGFADGKAPAVLGLDLIEYTPSRVERGSTSTAVESAIQFDEAGGIVTFCWHWNAPSKYLTGQWYRGFYKEETNINLKKIMDGEDQEGYDLLLEDIDAIAVQLKKLQDAGVPVLWRPLHEASGGWFWWGNAGADAYKELYILLYDRLTNYHGLNNLIWVWNGQAADWYPGDEYVDIVSTDIYPGERVYSSQINSFLETRDFAEGKKMVILSENGCLFDPELAYRDRAMWGLWCTWGGEFVTLGNGLNKLSEKYTEKEMVQKAYESEYVITLDELPDLKTYEIKE